MTKKTATKTKPAKPAQPGKPGAAALPPPHTIGTLIEVPIDQIAPSRFQKRVFDDTAKTKLEELAASIRQEGILQRPLVIKRKDKKQPYEFVFGERRVRAAKIAGLTKVLVDLVDWPDQKIRQAHIDENNQRENLHDLELAAEFADLRDSVTPPMDIRELALRVAKSERETARIVALNNLIEPAKKMLRDGLITRGHADQIARLSPDVQPETLDACFEQVHVRYDQKTRTQIYKPNYDAPVTVNTLVKWVAKNLVRDLSKVPWQVDDETLVPTQGPCSTCAFNTAANQLLFADAAPTGMALCTNGDGFARKMDAWIARQIKEIGNPTLLFGESSYNVKADDKKKWPKALTTDDFHSAEAKGDKCAYAIPALWVTGENAGRLTSICIEPTCPSHAGRRVSNTSTRSSGPAKEKSPDERRQFLQRRQEIFDIKVAEVVRRSVMRDVIRKIKPGQIDRKWRERMATEAFLRLPHHDSTVLMDVLGRDDLPQVAHERGKLAAKIAKMKDDELARLLYLCAFVHYGANPGAAKFESQTDVSTLATEMGIEYRLIDAEVRVALASKKYQKRHEDYLAIVQDGRKADVPRVYDEPDAVAAAPKAKSQPSVKSAQTGKARAKAGKRAKKR